MNDSPIKTLRKPDFSNLQAILKRETPSRPTLFEFIAEPLPMLGEAKSSGDADAQIQQYLRCFFENGYDFACLPSWLTGFLEFEKGDQGHGESISQNQGGLIHDEESFEAYPWPDPGKADYARIKDWEQWLPGGAKFLVMCPGGILENLTDLVSFEELCYLLADEPELVGRIAEAIGSRLLVYYERLLAYDCVGACVVNDDWGFKTSTMISPAQMREHVIPWHKKIVQLIHDAGRPAILHSCGNLELVWEDIIEDIGYDAKHSYEDGILPVEEAYQTYGDRIAILGGIDMDFLTRQDEVTVRRRAEGLIRMASGRGGYALGSGNSIARYVPRENFLALRDVGLSGMQTNDFL